ncbi:MAG: hypothetical protein M1546_12870 [Chloroflexi bacterium]|nr:hypothetical protein [Chloroflexota bacterium]
MITLPSLLESNVVSWKLGSIGEAILGERPDKTPTLAIEFLKDIEQTLHDYSTSKQEASIMLTPSGQFEGVGEFTAFADSLNQTVCAIGALIDYFTSLSSGESPRFTQNLAMVLLTFVELQLFENRDATVWSLAKELDTESS